VLIVRERGEMGVEEWCKHSNSLSAILIKDLLTDLQKALFYKPVPNI